MPEIGDRRISESDAVYRPRECYTLNGQRKQTFRTKAEAKRAIKKLVGTSHTGAPVQRNMTAYRCGVCGSFHLGHRP